MSGEEAVQIAKKRLVGNPEVTAIKRKDMIEKHHEYRAGPLPANVIS